MSPEVIPIKQGVSETEYLENFFLVATMVNFMWQLG